MSQSTVATYHLLERAFLAVLSGLKNVHQVFSVAGKQHDRTSGCTVNAKTLAKLVVRSRIAQCRGTRQAMGGAAAHRRWGVGGVPDYHILDVSAVQMSEEEVSLGKSRDAGRLG